MNKNRVILAGLAAGVVWTVIDFAIHGGLLAKSYEGLVKAGVITEPPGWFLPLLILMNLLVGLTLAFLYASIRATLGKGPGTAIRLGVCIFILYLPFLVSQIAFYKLGQDVNMWSVIGGLAQTLGASLVAGWLYKD